MSDRIAVMNRGKVEQLGTPEELYERPTTRFVADFIGTTNLLTGSVESADGAAGTALVRLERRRRVRRRRSRVSRSGGSVELSVRPESVSIKAANGRSPDGPDPIRGTVEQVAYLGGNVQYHRPHGRRTLDHRAGAEDRAATAGRQRRRRHAGRRPRHSSSPAGPTDAGGGPGMTERSDGSSDRPREGAHPLHGRAPDQPARSCSSGSRSSAGRRRSRRSSPPARARAAAPRRRRRRPSACRRPRRPRRRRRRQRSPRRPSPRRRRS